LVPLVFVAWVNMDDWFLLGPALAALFWLGERLHGSDRRRVGCVSRAAACLLNPYTFRAFTLPPELSTVPWSTGLRQDPRFQALFASPWSSTYLHAARRAERRGIGYYMLVMLGLLSFLLTSRRCGTGVSSSGFRSHYWPPGSTGDSVLRGRCGAHHGSQRAGLLRWHS